MISAGYTGPLTDLHENGVALEVGDPLLDEDEEHLIHFVLQKRVQERIRSAGYRKEQAEQEGNESELKPLFLYYPTSLMHAPYRAPKKYTDRCRQISVGDGYVSLSVGVDVYVSVGVDVYVSLFFYLLYTGAVQCSCFMWSGALDC